MEKILLKNCRYLVTHPSPIDGVIEDGGLYIEGPEIKAVGASAEIEAAFGSQPDLQVLDAHDKIVLPGLIDAHNHVGEAHSLLVFGWLDNPIRGIVDATNEVYWPAHAWLINDRAFDLTMLGMVNLIKHGTTTHANAMPFPHAGYQAAVEAGVRAILHPQIVTSVQLPDAKGEREYLAQTEDVIQSYHGAHDGRIRVGVHPNALYNCTPTSLIEGMKLAEKYDVQFAVHMAESPDEKNGLDTIWADEGGMIVHLLNAGLLTSKTLVFHGTLFEEKEIDALAEVGAALVHCPATNAMFGYCAYLPYMLKAGLCIGLGTDCVTHNLFNVMLSVSQHHNIMPRMLKGVDPWVLLELATIGGARALGLEDEVGSLEGGKRADVITINLRGNTSLFPLNNKILASMLALNGAGMEAEDVMVDGIFLRRDGKFTALDEEAILARAQSLCDQFSVDYLHAKREGRPMVQKVHEEFLPE